MPSPSFLLHRGADARRHPATAVLRTSPLPTPHHPVVDDRHVAGRPTLRATTLRTAVPALLFAQSSGLLVVRDGGAVAIAFGGPMSRHIDMAVVVVSVVVVFRGRTRRQGRGTLRYITTGIRVLLSRSARSTPSPVVSFSSSLERCSVITSPSMSQPDRSHGRLRRSDTRTHRARGRP